MNIKVAVYLSPVPECDASYSFYRKAYESRHLAINHLEKQPNTHFVDYIHMTDQGAAANSARVAQTLRAWLYTR
jgi:hypothetical protein